uniref:Uncharacterized protein n=1 Tax=Schizaphis graminum TaxID=13262 RepID=A0A2S2PUN0_SCHGA
MTIYIHTRATRTRTNTNTRDVLNATRSRRMRFVTDTVVADVGVRVSVRRGMDWVLPPLPCPPFCLRCRYAYGARTHGSRWVGGRRSGVCRAGWCVQSSAVGACRTKKKIPTTIIIIKTRAPRRPPTTNVFGDRGPHRNAAHRHATTADRCIYACYTRIYTANNINALIVFFPYPLNPTFVIYSYSAG